MKLSKSSFDNTIFICECGTPVMEAFFDQMGYLHTSAVEFCQNCGREVDEDDLDEDDVEIMG